MAVVSVHEANLADLLQQHRFVVLDFWAAWCAPCRGFAPLWQAAAERHRDLLFATVDVDAEESLARAFGIRTVPTLLAIRERILVARHPGAPTEAGLAQWLERCRLIDMDDLRQALAAAEGDADAIDH